MTNKLLLIILLLWVCFGVWNSPIVIPQTYSNKCWYKINIRVDKLFTEQERYLISAAFETWHTADRRACFYLRNANVENEQNIYLNDDRITIYSCKKEWQRKFAINRHNCDPNEGCLGVVVKLGKSDMFLIRREYFKSLVIHEIGHILGLQHTQDIKDVMNETISGNTILSNNDIRKLKCLIVNHNILTHPNNCN